MLDELLSDLGQGHNVVSTVFVECMSEYRSAGPEALRPVGETDFVERIAAEAERRGAGTPRVAAGIISYADLTLGAAVDQVLEAHLAASPRFRGIRHASGWDASPDIRNSHTNPPEHLLLDSKFREGFARLARYGLVFDSWQYHPQLADLADLARAFPETTIILDHVGGPLGIGPYEGRHAEVFREWKRGVAGRRRLPQRGGEAGRHRDAGQRLRLAQARRAAELRSSSPHRSARTTRPASSCSGPSRCMFESNFPVDRV